MDNELAESKQKSEQTQAKKIGSNMILGELEDKKKQWNNKNNEEENYD